MNIVEIIKKNGDSIGLRYYGIDDMATGIMVKNLLENKNDILAHFKNTIITNIDDYIDYIFIEIVIKFYEVIPYVLEEKREEFTEFLDKCNIIYEKYTIKNIVEFINKNYLEIYSYEDSENTLYIKHDLKDYTSDFIGLHFNSFTNYVIEYVMNDFTYDVIDNFDKWQQYFVKKPDELSKLFNQNNIKKIFAMRFDKMSNILQTLNTNNKFSATINSAIDIIYNIVKDNYFNPIGDTEIWQSYYIISDCLIFFKKIKSPYSYELEKVFYQQEVKFNENLLKNGHSTKIDFDLKPFIDFFENEEKPWEIRIAYLTHSKNEQNELKSFLEHGAKSNIKALTDDLARNNPGTSDYFTSWRLRNLSLYSFEVQSRIMFILSNNKNISEYLSCMYGELRYICTNINTTIELEELDNNMEMLSQYLTDLFINFPNNKLISEITVKNTIYGCSMFLCGLIEKVMRTIYKYNVQKKSYIPDSSITLGNLLSESDKNTNVILDILGIEQMKCLRYFLHKVEFDNIGENIRNDLAHLNGRTMRKLNHNLIIELLSYLNSILNSCVLYYQNKEKNKC